MTCESCTFYFVPNCRRYPPQCVGSHMGVASHWPTVQPHDVACGEHEPKLEPVKSAPPPPAVKQPRKPRHEAEQFSLANVSSTPTARIRAG